ncbi:hypothetical protein B0H13DRAFT_2565195 [Mycena leptocephala]|nr:hypothetical protein B0H13DRAFT_2565195 [Mycena leptocephala]
MATSALICPSLATPASAMTTSWRHLPLPQTYLFIIPAIECIEQHLHAAARAGVACSTICVRDNTHRLTHALPIPPQLAACASAALRLALYAPRPHHPFLETQEPGTVMPPLAFTPPHRRRIPCPSSVLPSGPSTQTRCTCARRQKRTIYVPAISAREPRYRLAAQCALERAIRPLHCVALPHPCTSRARALDLHPLQHEFLSRISELILLSSTLRLSIHLLHVPSQFELGQLEQVGLKCEDASEASSGTWTLCSSRGLK